MGIIGCASAKAGSPLSDSAVRPGRPRLCRLVPRVRRRAVRSRVEPHPSRSDRTESLPSALAYVLPPSPKPRSAPLPYPAGHALNPCGFDAAEARPGRTAIAPRAPPPCRLALSSPPPNRLGSRLESTRALERQAAGVGSRPASPIRHPSRHRHRTDGA
jgi:hypothetical protein